MPKELVKATVPKRVEDALRAFETELGGREQVLEGLYTLPANKDVDYVIGLIADPRNDNLSLAEICSLGGITIGKLLSFWKEASGMKAQLLAINKVNQYLPNVAEDIMLRSLPQSEPCGRCEGTGLVKVAKPDGTTDSANCWKCSGNGKLIIAPNLETQKVALQLGKLLTKDPAVAINQQFNSNSQQNAYFTGDDFRSFRSASDKLLFPGKDRSVVKDEDPIDEPIDAEIIKSEPKS